MHQDNHRSHYFVLCEPLSLASAFWILFICVRVRVLLFFCLLRFCWAVSLAKTHSSSISISSLMLWLTRKKNRICGIKASDHEVIDEMMKRTCDTSQTFQTTSNRHFNWSECILLRKKQQPHSKKKHTHRKRSQASRCYCTVIIEVSYFKVKSSHNNLQIHRKGFNRECIGREENNQKKEKKCQQLGYYTLWMREPANAIETCILEDRHLKCALNVDFERLLHSMCACVHFFFCL